ncbi:MAG: SUMF1/EgtB/PvdO family nonheme iron enzyme [Bacteroidaceae bacterium]|nr:SUMF1/EgtB/PvdO family nonheme iron enzyme [Bacteroidaceae bacterium]
MKATTVYISIALSVLLTSSFLSCSSEDMFEVMEQQNNTKPKTCPLILNANKVSFDSGNATRSTDNASSDWKEGDKIYLTFSNGTGNTYGDAVYESGEWIVNYYGTLIEGEATECIAVYFDNIKNEGNTSIMIDESTGIYEDRNGQYVYNNGVLSVTATLSPKVGRIKFAGEEKDSITVYGITHYTGYDYSTGKFSSTSVALKTKAKSGYTPYIYGEFSDTLQPRLNIITSTSGYTRFIPTTIFKKGESGYMDIPTVSSHKGWQQTLMMKVRGVEFTMIPVEYSEGFFLLAETETTEQLYAAITGQTATTSRIPASQGYDIWKTFVSEIQNITNLNFYIPTREEWTYASNGGNCSQNYIYSGSNILSDVAWYAENSNNKLHEVKQLHPNELGFYDMNGNESEYVQYVGGYYYYYGGSFNSPKSNISYKCYHGTSYSTSQGLRVALKP